MSDDVLTRSPRELLDPDVDVVEGRPRWRWYDTSGAFDVPAGVTRVWVALVGGNGGDFLTAEVTVTAWASIAIKVPRGGAVVVQWDEPSNAAHE